MRVESHAKVAKAAHTCQWCESSAIVAFGPQAPQRAPGRCVHGAMSVFEVVDGGCPDGSLKSLAIEHHSTEREATLRGVAQAVARQKEKRMKRIILAVITGGIWIDFSEFARNELLLKSYWLDKYESLGLTFPSASVNNAMWAVWGFILAGCIAFFARTHTLIETVLLAWVMAFLMMWIVIWNLGVLPVRLLSVAVPWSIVEVTVAALIAKRVLRPTGAD